MMSSLQRALHRYGFVSLPNAERKTHWRPGVILKSVHTSVGLFTLAAIATLGPIDFIRTVYNASIGDTTPLKRELLDYTIKNIQTQQPTLSLENLETTLKKELEMQDYQLGTTSPGELRMERLFDAAEKYAPNAFERYLWPILRK
ncbi:MAG: hypothetical protein Q7R96_04495 [Nanoarchaeota archaeon]|nr:hypothetical protein [Nanoarchaeota archaeon]